jgi:hypothetical protein
MLATAASADMVPFTDNTALSTEGAGRYAGSLTYTYLGGSSGRLDVAMTNTTSPAIGGYITAFMFRTPDAMGMVSAMLTLSDNGLASNIPAGTTAPPFPGTWIGGAGVAPDWLAHGTVSNGIAVGSTGHWTFSITSASASLLTAGSFIKNAVNTDPYAFGFASAA